MKLPEDIDEWPSTFNKNLLKPLPVWPMQQELCLGVWGNLVAPVAMVQHVGCNVQISYQHNVPPSLQHCGDSMTQNLKQT